MTIIELPSDSARWFRASTVRRASPPPSYSCFDVFEMMVCLPLFATVVLTEEPDHVWTVFACAVLTWFSIRLSVLYSKYYRHRDMHMPVVCTCAQWVSLVIMVAYSSYGSSDVSPILFVFTLAMMANMILYSPNGKLEHAYVHVGSSECYDPGV